MENFDKIQEEIIKLQTSYAAIQEKWKKIKADMPVNPAKPAQDDDGDNPDMEDMMDMMKEMNDNMNARMGYVWNAISSLRDSHQQHHKNLDQHMNIGHMPKMTAGQLQKVLDKCGMAGDFNVEKPTIYASTNGRKLNFIAEYKKPVA